MFPPYLRAGGSWGRRAGPQQESPSWCPMEMPRGHLLDTKGARRWGPGYPKRAHSVGIPGVPLRHGWGWPNLAPLFHELWRPHLYSFRWGMIHTEAGWTSFPGWLRIFLGFPKTPPLTPLHLFFLVRRKAVIITAKTTATAASNWATPLGQARR